ncbi:hypothetical protein FRY74_11545 [Vicingus serpentipes]|uniref:Capsule assembly Wzi family protein n=1 Tax=Vicingus serpentipes TaxID=1926625 RepID=A0A5C6RNS7_9FLAO|nr:hypothetical protein [Vicingus serpentipes]TXB63883.1 hypothetical protein FRY74_11545 [Vicingus serpentipes]
MFKKQIDTAPNSHPSIQPYSANELNQNFNYDSTIYNLNVNTNSGFVKVLMNSDKPNTSIEKELAILASPIINLGAGIEKSQTTSRSLNELAFGLNFKTYIGKKWSGQFAFIADKSNYPSHIDLLLKTQNTGQGYGYTKDNQAMYYQGNLTFTPNDIFTIQAGVGKHFIGDGYRSLLLSDYANSYPYLKVTANIWKIKYMALYTNFQDINYSSGNYSDYRQKFATIHYLSYNATKWLNIGFFESIIFQAQEDNYYRGYDLNYLNPVLFLRPAEYHQGSADNALLGGSLKVRIKKKNILYSQLLLDEFLLKELRDNNGWWANKYAIQLGFKSYDFLGINNLKVQAEYNVVRPFTYSYYQDASTLNTLQNYGHFNSPLAHPLGANFNEVVGGITYNNKRWIFEAMTSLASVGLDSNNFSVGQNIYQPYNNREQDYGYNTGGGINTKIMNNSLKVSFVLNPEMQTIIQLGVNNRTVKNDYSNSSTNWISFGIKTALINQYFDN